jgi:heptosyltransferase-2
VKILVRSTNWIGDAVMTTVALRALRARYPQAEIHVIAIPWVAPVFENSPDVDRVIELDRTGKHSSWLQRFHYLRTLESASYDVGIIFPNSFSTALEVKMAGCKKIQGYAGNGRNFLMTNVIPRNQNTRIGHEIYYYLKLLGNHGLLPDNIFPKIHLRPTEIEQATLWLKEVKQERKGVVGIAPGAAYGSAKIWGLDKLKILVEKLAAENFSLLIFGGKKEEEAGNQLKKIAPDHVFNCAGSVGLREFFSLLSACDCFVTNDSGPMHVGAALDVPMVAIFGSTDPIRTGPFSHQAKILRKTMDCAPCRKRECPLGHRNCMEEITVDEVFQTIIAKVTRSDM